MPKVKTAEAKAAKVRVVAAKATAKAVAAEVTAVEVKAVGTPGVRRQPKTDMIRVRIDPTLKDRAETILGHLGLSASDAIRLFYSQITLAEGLPFPVKIPNAETRQAMNEADAGRGNRYASAAEMFKKLGL
jgi:DNA-damage-inducible protein J